MRISNAEFENPEGLMPLRLTVGVMVFNKDGLVWLGRRFPKWLCDHSAHIWQMPQGGVEPFEPAHVAAEREVREETGITSLQLIDEFPGWLTSELPPELIGIALQGRYRGQRQKWYAARFLGTEREIDLDASGPQNREFESWRWAPIDSVAKLGAPHKRDIHETVVARFRKFATAT